MSRAITFWFPSAFWPTEDGPRRRSPALKLNVTTWLIVAREGLGAAKAMATIHPKRIVQKAIKLTNYYLSTKKTKC
jgi:hypothetical protein